MRESVRGQRAQEASSDFIVNYRLRLFGGIAASFQVQIIIRILLWPLRKKDRSAETTYIQPIPGYTHACTVNGYMVASGQTQLAWNSRKSTPLPHSAQGRERA